VVLGNLRKKLSYDSHKKLRKDEISFES